MKCLVCGNKINWDNSHGWSKNTCICHSCLQRIWKRPDVRDTGHALEIINNIGRAIEKERKKLVNLVYGGNN